MRCARCKQNLKYLEHGTKEQPICYDCSYPWDSRYFDGRMPFPPGFSDLKPVTGETKNG